MRAWFKRLWLWIRSWVRRPPEEAPSGPLPKEKPAKPLMHWCPDRPGVPICGAPRNTVALWTIEVESVTCPTCRDLGMWRILAHVTSTR